MSKKRIAVVGGGLAGLCSVFWLRRYGFEAICFEKTSELCGTWCYREESTLGVPSIMPTTIINHSKEIGAFSEFPPNPEYSNYMRHTEMYEYSMNCFKKHGIPDHVRKNTEVISVKRTDDYDVTKRWQVTVQDLVTGVVSSDVYDGVVVCVGHINRPKMPSYEGQERFQGKIIHTHSLKGVEKYRGQNVVVVGMGCSALDAAVEISSVAKQVYLSTRSGAWVINRVGYNGCPIDLLITRRWILTTLSYFPSDWVSWMFETFYLDPYFNSNLYSVKPKYHALSKDPVFNDHIHSKLLSGSVLQTTDIDHFTESGVVFEGEEEAVEVDSVIMATGYTWQFPFLEEGIVVKKGNRIDLYKCMYPPHLPHATLAIVGFCLPFGPGIPIGEMQCRVAAHFMAGKGQLPTKEVMMKDIIERHQRNEVRYPYSDKITLRVDLLQYLNELSDMIGARPKLWKYLFTDFWLFWKLMNGALVPYQFRLEGPFAWEGAREAIMTADDRIKAAYKKRKVHGGKRSNE